MYMYVLYLLKAGCWGGGGGGGLYKGCVYTPDLVIHYMYSCVHALCTYSKAKDKTEEGNDIFEKNLVVFLSGPESPYS